jgi:hypothetical protein
MNTRAISRYDKSEKHESSNPQHIKQVLISYNDRLPKSCLRLLIDKGPDGKYARESQFSHGSVLTIREYFRAERSIRMGTNHAERNSSLRLGRASEVNQYSFLKSAL